jgi:metallo-beta-lactamase class B
VGDLKAAAPGARIGMIASDWEMYVNRRGGGRYEPIAKDLVIKDGDTITVGDTLFTFYQTPGHTLGVLSMSFDVRDGGATHKAFVLGGAGLNFGGVTQSELFVKSMERVKAMPGIEVNLANHPTMCGAFERAEKLKTRKAGDPHPFVDPDGFYAFIDKLLYDGNAKLRLERAR